MEQTAYVEQGGAARRDARGGRVPEGYFERMRAPFSLRCGALLIDYTVLAAILAFATLLARVFGGDKQWGGSTMLTLGYVTAAGAALLNFVVLAGLSGRTVGKWVTGLRIERRATGEPVSFGRALARHSVGYLLTLLTGGLGFLLAAFGGQGRALHDLVAGTVVVRGSRAARAHTRRLR